MNSRPSNRTVVLTLAALPVVVLCVDLVCVCGRYYYTTEYNHDGKVLWGGLLPWSVGACIYPAERRCSDIGHCRSVISGSQESGNAAGGTDEVQCQLATYI